MNKVVLWVKQIGLKKLLFGVVTLLIIAGAIFILSNRSTKLEPRFQEAFNAGNYELAIKELEPSIYKGETDPAILRTVAASYIQKALIEKKKVSQSLSVAISYLNAAVKGEKRNSENYRLLGVAYTLLDKHTEAEANLKKALDLDDNNAEAHVGIGILYEKKGDTVRARNSFRKALDVDPKNETAEVGMARVSIEAKDFKAALDHASRVTLSTNKSVQQEAYLLQGSAYMTYGKIKSALESYNKAVELGSTNPHLHVLIAQAYVKEYLSFVRLNNLVPMSKKALEETDKALKIDPNYIYAYVTKHQIYMMLKDTKMADTVGKKIVSLLPNDKTLSKEQKDFYALYYKKVPTVTVTNIKVEKK